MSDTIVVMNDGVIQQMGHPIDIYNEPKTPLLQTLLVIHIYNAA